MTSPSTIQPKFLSESDELGVVAVGFSGGQCKPGVDAAPSALISSGLLTQLKEDLGYNLFHDDTVHSYDSITPETDPDFRNMKKPLTVSAVTQQLSQQVYQHARQGRCVLTLGGDHSIAIGTVSGTAKAIRERLGREMAVIWVDAHADINTPETSDSGNIHGMPVAFLTGLAEEKREDVFGWLKEDQKISLKKLVYIGLRDVDRGEKKILRDYGIKAFSMHDIDRHGIGRVMDMALGHIGSDTPIHLSFDVDALDPQWAPSTGTPVRGGLTLREGDYIAECVHETGSLVAMDLVEVNPSLEALGAAETIRAGCSLSLDAAKGDRERVIILGSGWAGYILSRKLSAKKFQTLVVSPRSYFVFTPLLTSAASGTLEFRTTLEPVRSRDYPSVEYTQGWADEVDFNRQTVTVEEAVLDRNQGRAMTEDRHAFETKSQAAALKGKDLPKGQLWDVGYDKLVISVGCYIQTFGTKGVKEHAYFLKDIGDARRIRKRILELFEVASLPTTSEERKRTLLRFVVVGGGPTGMEFAAELSDLVHVDLGKLYPDLASMVEIIVFDVAPRVLSMFDESLGEYAMKTYKREGIEIKTSHHVEELRPGSPKDARTQNSSEKNESESCYTITTKEEGEIGIGMCVWSTGNMMNPFVQKTTSRTHHLPPSSLQSIPGKTPPSEDSDTWKVDRNEKTGAFLVDSRFRLQLTQSPSSQRNDNEIDTTRAFLPNVFALGDNASLRDYVLPVTAQVANQQARWLAKRLNSGTRSLDETPGFKFRDLGVMTYLGNGKGLLQAPPGNKWLGRWFKGLRGRLAWLVWRGAYLGLSISWRNRVLIPVYWFVNWAFGRDITRF